MPVVSRPLLIALALAVVALVGFYATRGSGDSNGAPPPEAVTAPPPTGDATGSSPTGDAASSRPTSAKPPRRSRAAQTGMPPEVARALRARQIVVLLFRGSDSADDRATARAVAGLRGRRGVAVFSAPLRKLGRYRAVVGDLGISQAPAVVIVDRRRRARVVEGYIDPATLAQDLADAR